MSHCRSFCTFKTGPKIILLTVTLYLIFPLSHRKLGPLFDGRVVDVSYEFFPDPAAKGLAQYFVLD